MRRMLIILLAAGIVIVVAISILFPVVEVDTATRAILRYHYIDKSIDLTVTDDKDVKALKKILRGRALPGGHACGFGVDVSIALTDGHKSITFCPACDGDPFIRVNQSNRYFTISDEQRAQLDRILAKYGMTFPCI